MAKAGMRRPDPKASTEKVRQAKLRNEKAQVGDNKQKNKTDEEQIKPL